MRIIVEEYGNPFIHCLKLGHLLREMKTQREYNVLLGASLTNSFILAQKYFVNRLLEIDPLRQSDAYMRH